MLNKALKCLAWIILSAAAVSFGIYLWLFKLPLTNAKINILKTARLPIAKVGAEKIYISEVLLYRQIQNNLFPAQKTNLKLTLQNLILQKKNRALAKKLSMEATSRQIAQELSYLSKQFSDLQTQTQKLGLDETQFTNSFLAQWVEKNNLRVWYNSQPSLNKEAYALAADLKNKAKSLDEFAELAAKFSQDENSNKIDGDLGFLPSAQIMPEMQAKLQNLAVSQSQIIPSRLGLHLIFAEEIEPKTARTESRLHLRQIFLKTSGFEHWLKSQSAQILEKTYVKL